MERKRYAAALITLTWALCLIGALFAFGSQQRAIERLERTVGAVYEESPEAAELMLKKLLTADAESPDSVDGIAAAKALGYTGRVYSFFRGELYPPVLTALGGLFLLSVAALAPVFLLTEKRREARRQEQLKARVEKALSGGAAFHAEREDELILEKLLSEIARLGANQRDREDELRRYVENVAHEIKTPTAGLVLNLDLLEQGGVSPERLYQARRCVERIQVYINRLLTLARLRAGKLRFEKEPVDLGELIDDISREYAAAGAALKLENNEAIYINGDRERLRDALSNLVRNAVKHGGADTTVSLEMKRLGGDIRLRISDRGEGLTGGETDALFERYFVGKEDGSSTGIGLSLAKEIIERHYGKIILSPGETGGTNVDVCFPVFGLKSSLV